MSSYFGSNSTNERLCHSKEIASKMLLKRFDVHSKAIDGVHQQTLLGAVLTLVTTILVFVLLFVEISVFFKIEVVSRMVIDKSYGVEAVEVEFDLGFPKISCDGISFTQEVTRGNIHFLETATELKKIDIEVDPTSWTGCRVTGKFLTDKVAGNFRFAIAPQRVALNITHTLARVGFYPTSNIIKKGKVPIISQGTVVVPEDTSIYQYSITVVPTQYKTLYGELSFGSEYSIIEKPVPKDFAPTFLAQNSLFIKDFQGLIFSYDFHPVSLFLSGLWQFFNLFYRR